MTQDLSLIVYLTFFLSGLNFCFLLANAVHMLKLAKFIVAIWDYFCLRDKQ